MVSNEPFFHRRNKDGVIDSICTRCYVTVGTPRNEALPEIEDNHTCDPYWLLRWQPRIRLSRYRRWTFNVHSRHQKNGVRRSKECPLADC